MTKKQPAKNPAKMAGCKKQTKPRTRTFWVYTCSTRYLGPWLISKHCLNGAIDQRDFNIERGYKCGPIVKVEVPLP